LKRKERMYKKMRAQNLIGKVLYRNLMRYGSLFDHNPKLKAFPPSPHFSLHKSYVEQVSLFFRKFLYLRQKNLLRNEPLQFDLHFALLRKMAFSAHAFQPMFGYDLNYRYPLYSNFVPPWIKNGEIVDDFRKIRKGTLLVSMPSIHSGFFNRTVIFLYDMNYSTQLVKGFIVNKPQFENVSNDDTTTRAVFQGGPVRRDSLRLIVRENKGDITFEEVDAQTNSDSVQNIISALERRDERFKVFLGNSMWSIKQLENEFNNKSWIAINGSFAGDYALINRDQNDHQLFVWRHIMNEIKGDIPAFIDIEPVQQKEKKELN